MLQVMAASGVSNPRLFGSLARGQDTRASDVDLLLTFPDGADIADILHLEEQLAALLTVPVDVVGDLGDGAVLNRARAEAVPL